MGSHTSGHQITHPLSGTAYFDSSGNFIPIDWGDDLINGIAAISPVSTRLRATLLHNHRHSQKALCAAAS